MSDLTHWTYKRSHSITSATPLTNYQVKIRVYRTEGTSDNLMKQYSNLDINYSINLTMPPNQISTISIVSIIDKIELFEYICQSTPIPLKEGTYLQLIPRLGTFYMVIDDFLYND